MFTFTLIKPFFIILLNLKKIIVKNKWLLNQELRCTMELILLLIFINVMAFLFALSTEKGKKKKPKWVP